MFIISFLKSLFETTQFHPGDRVNHVPRGVMSATDGHVLAQTHHGVMVEFPRKGIFVVDSRELCLIG
jgi:hypothetical protein